MPTAEIIAIGTELLLGEIVDTNSKFIARRLRDIGIDLYRTVAVGDNVNRIERAVSEAIEKNDIVITTGGLGPTIDDMTREGIAQALNKNLIFQDVLWDQIQQRFERFGRKPTENNRRQAFAPDGATLIENPRGTAPVFIIDEDEYSILTLPGVPREMEYLFENRMLPFIKKKYPTKELIKTRILHTGGVGESQIDEKITDLEKMSNPTVGLAAHLGQVDIRITAKAESESEAIQKIEPVEQQIRERLGKWIYGTDGESIEDIVLKKLDQLHYKFSAIECGLQGQLIQRLAASSSRIFTQKDQILVEGRILLCPNSVQEFENTVNKQLNQNQADLVFGVLLTEESDNYVCSTFITTSDKSTMDQQRYTGPLPFVIRWSLHNSLDFLRRTDL